jgi:Protein of unknown function (DUF3990)
VTKPIFGEFLMPWNNNDLTVYHGTDDDAERNIRRNGIDLTYCRALADFGRGFYTTTNHHQAQNWADLRYRRRRNTLPGIRPVVLTFTIDRNRLAKLNTLFFVTEGLIPPTTDYWELVQHCRQGLQNMHIQSGNQGSYYDVVCGPVSLWKQTLVIKDCDQISFHNENNPDPIYKPRNRNSLLTIS